MATRKTTADESAVEVNAVKAAPEKGSSEWWKEEIPFMAFKDGKRYKDDLVVGVNGKFWRIQRGVEVMLPRFVVEEINNSMRQDVAAAEYTERESAKANF